MSITTEQLEQVRNAVSQAFKPWSHDITSLGDDGELVESDTHAPVARMDFDWVGTGPQPAIVWEDGSPYEWVHLFPFGGIDEEYGFNVPNVNNLLPKGVFVEPATNWAIHVYEA